MASTDSLKILGIFGRTDSTGAAAADVDQEELRLNASATLAPGFLPNMLNQSFNANAFRVRQDTGSNMNVKVGSGTTKVDGYVLQGTTAGQGSYVVRLEATTKTVSVPAADATNPARYGVYLFVNDTAYGGTAARAFVDVNCIRGTPAGSPVTPGPLAAWSASVLLWEFQLPANATAVTNTILDAGTDDRVASASPLPGLGLRPFTTTAKRDATIGSPVEGQEVAVTGEDRIYTYNGAGWVRTGHYATAGRTGFDISRAGSVQAVANSTQTTVTFDTVTLDTDAWHSGATFTFLTVPTGADGMYALSVLLSWSVAGISTEGVWLSISGTDYLLTAFTAPAVSSANRVYSANVPLAATQQFGIKVFQTSGGSDNLNITLRGIRIGF